MKSLLFLSFLVTIMTVSLAFASGALVLKGQIAGFDEKEYKIATAGVIYVIKRSGLNSEQLADLKKKHSGDIVQLQVTTDSIEKVYAQAPPK